MRHSAVSHANRTAIQFVALIAPAFLLLGLSISAPLPGPEWLLASLAFVLMLLYPGYLFELIVSRRCGFGRAETAVAFALSVGIWSVVAALVQTLGGSLRLFEALILVSVLFMAAGAALRQPYAHGAPNLRRFLDRWRRQPAYGWATDLLFWSAVAATLVIFAYYASVWRQSDRWDYQGAIRAFLDNPTLTLPTHLSGVEGGSRLTLAPWLVIMSSMQRISGVSLTNLYSYYVPAWLLLIALCSTFALARTVLLTRWAAAIAVMLLVIYWVSDIALPWMGSFSWEERMLLRLDGGQSSLGQWALLGRIVEDKFLLLFVLLPVTQAIVMRFLLRGDRRMLILLLVMVAGAVVMHPLGIVFLAFTLAAFGVPLLFMRFSWPRLQRCLWLGVILTVAALIPLAQSLALGGNLGSTGVGIRSAQQFIDQGANNGLWVSSVSESIYAAHIYLIGRRELLVIALLLLPVLLILRGLRRPRWQFLTGAIVTSLLVTFNPLVAPWLGRLITWQMLFRTYWLIVLPCILVLAAGVALGTSWLRIRMRPASVGRRLWPLIPFVCAGLLLWGFWPKIAAGNQLLSEIQQHSLSPAELDVLHYLRDQARPGSTVLADDWLGNELPGEVGTVHGIAFRTMGIDPDAYAGVRSFYLNDDINAGRLALLDKYDINYVVVTSGSGTDRQLAQLAPAIQATYATPQYRVYMLTPDWRNAPLIQQLMAAQNLFAVGDWEAAAQAANAAYQLAPDNFMARQLLSTLASRQADFTAAIKWVQPIHAANPEAAWAQHLLADAYITQGATLEAQFQPGEAIAAYNLALSADPQSKAAARALLRLNAASNREVLTADQVDNLIAIFAAQATSPQDRLSYLSRRAFWDLAEANELAGRLEASEAAYQSALKITRPQDSEAEAAAKYGRFLVRHGEFAAASALYQSALARNANAEDLYAALGDLETSLGVTDATETIFQAAAAANPRAAWPYMRLAELALQHASDLKP